MLRLADGTETMREIITEQFVQGFQMLFGCSDFEQRIEEQKILDFFGTQVKKTNLKALKARLEQMYVALMDTKYEYTFDEFGEYLMDEIIQRVPKIDWPLCGTWQMRQRLYAECMVIAKEDADELGEDPIEAGKNFYCAVMHLPELSYNGAYNWMLFWDGDFLCYRGWDPQKSSVPGTSCQKCTLDGEYVE